MTEHLLALLLKQALLLSGGVVLLAVLRKPLLRLGAGVTYAAWLLVPALLLTAALPRPTQEPLHVALEAAGGASLAAAPAALVAPAPTVAMAVLVAWLAGALLLAAALARRQWRLARLGIHLPAGSSPALVGVLRPRVALPRDFDQRFPPEQRQLILAHEEVHRARHDNAWNLLASALLAVHWWNPLAWWAARRFRADQELACDAAVLATRHHAIADYTRALLAAHDLEHPGAPLTSRWGSAHPLVERIAMLNRPLRPSRRQALSIALGLLGTAGVSYALQAAPAQPPVADGFLQLRYALKLSVDGQLVAQPRLVTFPASTASITFNEPSNQRLWMLSLNGKFSDEQHVRVETSISLNDDAAAIQAWAASGRKGRPPVPRVIAEPALLIADGESGRIEATTPDGHRLALDVTVTSFRNPTPDYTPPTAAPQPGTR